MTDYNIRIIADPTEAGRGIDKVDGKLKKLEGTTDRLNGLIKDVFAFAGVGLGIRELVNYTQQFTKIENTIRNVTKSEAQLVAVTEELFRISQETGTSFEKNAGLLKDFVEAGSQAGFSIQDSITLLENLDKIAVADGKNLEQLEGTYTRLARSFIDGTVAGNDFRLLIQQLPDVAFILADSLGVTVGELKALGDEGKITAATLRDALVGASDDINDKFSKTVPTIERGITAIQNSFVKMIGEFDKAKGSSAAVARFLLELADNMELLAKAAIIASTAIAVNFAQRALPLLAAALTNPVVLIGAVIAALFLFSDQIKLVGQEFGTFFDLIAVTLTAIGNFLDAFLQGTINTVRGLFGVSDETFKQFIEDAKDFGKVFPEAVFGAFIDMLNNVLGLLELAINKTGQLLDKAKTFVTGGESTYSPVAFSTLPTLDTLKLQAERRAQNEAIAAAKADKEREDQLAGLGVRGANRNFGGLAQVNDALERQKDLLKDIVIPQKEYKQTLADLDLLLKSNQISADQYALALDKVKLQSLEADRTMTGGLERGLLRLKEEFTNVSNVVEDGLVNAFQKGEDALVSFFTTGKFAAGDFFKSIADDITRYLVRQNITKPIIDALGSVGGGDFFSSIFSSIGGFFGFGGGKAAGGPVYKGQRYLVGETGPEEIVMGSNGTVIPNGGMGKGVEVNIYNNSNTKAEVQQSTDANGNQRIDVMIDEMVGHNIRNQGSSTNKAMTDMFGLSPSIVSR